MHDTCYLSYLVRKYGYFWTAIHRENILNGLFAASTASLISSTDLMWTDLSGPCWELHWSRSWWPQQWPPWLTHFQIAFTNINTLCRWQTQLFVCNLKKSYFGPSFFGLRTPVTSIFAHVCNTCTIPDSILSEQVSTLIRFH